jgi:hypothetical protein
VAAWSYSGGKGEGRKKRNEKIEGEKVWVLSPKFMTSESVWMKKPGN